MPGACQKNFIACMNTGKDKSVSIQPPFKTSILSHLKKQTMQKHSLHFLMLSSGITPAQ